MRATFSCRPEACPLPPSHGLPSSFPPWPVLTRPQAGSSSPPSLVLEPYGAGAWLLEPGRPGRGATTRVLDSVSLCLQSAPSGNTGPLCCREYIHLASLPALSPRGGGVLGLPLSCCVSQVAPLSPCPCPKTETPSCRETLQVSRRQQWGFAMIVSKAGVE